MSEEKNRKIKKTIQQFVRNPDRTSLLRLRYCPTECDVSSIDPSEFRSAEEVASDLCDVVIQSAVHFVNSKFEEQLLQQEYALPPSRLKRESIWPQIRHFRRGQTRDLIFEYVQKWHLSQSMKFCVRYTSTTSTCTGKYHHVEAIFSIPTPACPNPQAVARVFFTIEVSAVVPRSMPVFVTYKFEMFDQTHIADERFDFQNRLLKTILKCKTDFYLRLDF